jgi:hypothetical protein
VFAFKFELFNLKIELSKKKYLVHGVPHFASPSVTHVPYFASYVGDDLSAAACGKRTHGCFNFVMPDLMCKF